MNGTMDVREVFKAAVNEQGKNFVRGTTSTDAHLFLRHVSDMHSDEKWTPLATDEITQFFQPTRRVLDSAR